MPYKKQLHTIHCPRCNNDFTVLTPAYIRRQKDLKYGSYCPPCRAKILWERMSQEQKDIMNKKSHESLKENYSKLSDEKKKELITKRKEGVKRFWDSMTDEEKQKISDKRSNDRKEFLASITKEDMQVISSNISIGKLTAESNMSKEELLKRKIKKQQERKIWWDNKTEEEKIEIRKRLLNHSKFWETASDDEIELRRKVLIAANKKYNDNLTLEERINISRKKLKFSNVKNGFNDKFEKYFKDSTLSEEYYLKHEDMFSNNNVTHSWDYGIYDLKSNTIQMVIDLDGSYYHADNCDYDGLHAREEYDEKRFLSIPDNVKYCIIYENKFKQSFELMMRILLIDYNKYMNNIFDYCRSIPFPYPRYTEKELMRSYNQLLKLNSFYHQNISINSRIGDHIVNHFHPSIYHAHRNNCLSPYDAWYDDDLLRKVIENRVIYANHLNPNKILQGFNISKIAPKVSVFSAGRAKIIIHKYLNDMNEIFDPFSGFSGRMLGTISLGKKYIGQDIADRHIDESKQISQFLNMEDYVELREADILQSSGEYESLFTCPPYGEKESWESTTRKIKSCDDWIDECLKRFKCKRYVFVVDHTIKYKDYIVDEIINKSHFGSNNEYLIIIHKQYKKKAGR